jgi:hypothetical protein
LRTLRGNSIGKGDPFALACRSRMQPLGLVLFLCKRVQNERDNLEDCKCFEEQNQPVMHFVFVCLFVSDEATFANAENFCTKKKEVKEVCTKSSILMNKQRRERKIIKKLVDEI